MATPVHAGNGSSSGTTGIVTSSTSSSTPVTDTIDVSAGDTVRASLTSYAGTAPSGTPTLDGQNGELVIAEEDATCHVYEYIWRNPNVGSARTFSWQPNSDGDKVITWIGKYTGVDGTTGYRNATSTIGTSATPGITVTSANGSKSVATFVSRSFPTFSTTSGTQRWLETTHGSGGSEINDTASSAHTWSVGAAGDDWATAGYELIGASSSTPASAGMRVMRVLYSWMDRWKQFAS